MPVCPFREKQEKCDGGCFMVSLGLPENDSVVEFPCLHDSFQSWPFCRAAVVVSDTYMSIIYIECFPYSRAAMAAGLCWDCHSVGGVYIGECLPTGSLFKSPERYTVRSNFLHLSDP